MLNVVSKQRYWSINGRFLSQRLTGVQRYAEETVRAIDELLTRQSPGTEGLAIEVLCPPGSRPLPGIRSITVREVGSGGGYLWEQATLPAHLKGSGLLSFGNTGPLSISKHVVCIHDANTRIFPQSYSRRFRLTYRVLLPALGVRAAKITTVSEFSKTQLEVFGIAKQHKISVLPNGHEHVHAWQSAHTDATRDAAGPDTIVLIGSPAPHKNMSLLLSLAADLKQLGLKLAVAGEVDRKAYECFGSSFPSSGVTSGPQDAIIWLGRVSNGALAALLKGSLCLAFPSFTEGFGLPALEAMALGCPVVASDRGSIPEVCGAAALYAAPEDPQAWLHQIRRLHSDRQLRATLIERGQVQAQRFSWQRSAECYIALMNELDWSARASAVRSWPLG